MDYVEINDPDSKAVIQFHAVMMEAFPNPYEREDISILRDNLREGSWESGGDVCRYHLVAAKSGEETVGGVSFYFFKSAAAECEHKGIGMGSYLAVKEELRGNGIGTKLIGVRNRILAGDARDFGCHLRGLIIQINDPLSMTEEEIRQDSMDPGERERFWRRLGYRKIDFKFIQPPIRAGEPPAEHLALYMFPCCQEWKNMERMSRADMSDIIDCFIKCTGTPGPTESDPSYLKMKAEINRCECFRIV